MSKLSGKIAIGAFLLGSLMLVPGASRATEPANNVGPYNNQNNTGYYGNPTLFGSTAGSGLFTWINFETISPTGDVDYALASCQGRVVKSVGINNLSADLDILVLDMFGTVLGGSNLGGTNAETFSVASLNKQAVVLRVMGFNGATSAYNVVVGC